MSQSTIIFSLSLHSLTNSVVDLTPHATPGKFRLLDCCQFLDNDVLAIHEFPDFPSLEYAAISYVWKGLSVNNSTAAVQGRYGTFTIKGAEAGDPISINVLKHVCTATIQSKATYLWLDGLCIMQSNGDDKAWQIGRMYNIYKSCTLCIVLPGGIQRLVQPEDDEPVTWIQRSWTLQEVLAPPRVGILFSWKYGEYRRSQSCSAAFTYTQVIKDESALCSLEHALSVHSGHLTLVTEQKVFKHLTLKIFGRINDAHVHTLLAILDGGRAGSEPGTQAIWRSSLMRTCTYPVDAVYSIMGVFGVTLDPHLFKQGDRQAATVALAREILKNGGKASWLAPGLQLPPCKGLSSFPEFPHVQAVGQATLTTEDGDRPVADLLPLVGKGWLQGIPMGTMDDTGYLTFSSKAAILVPAGHQSPSGDSFNKHVLQVTDETQLTAGDGSVWKIHPDGEEAHGPQMRTFIVFLGSLTQYNSSVFGRRIDPWAERAMLVEEHEARKFHRRSYFMLPLALKPYIERCQSYTFCLGGPV
ncbi:hypothetical protein HYDPIDRAFT_115658 [Hydnomerulius pinastri MD-312]|uniref:Heterokaryon incompatibility domain-containing protein n=1 Tax=Hydnomerulius pinastri MD-312 TaxID=994086 RepID=A0A0C9V779_9AGAM|nr:hypothetical protein HYDPIDRAFT_115658 [Hydnomerulius pinastri MD-312]